MVTDSHSAHLCPLGLLVILCDRPLLPCSSWPLVLWKVLDDPDARCRYDRTLDEQERMEHDRRCAFGRRRSTM